MKFEKINENKLKIVMSNDELPNSSSLDCFMKDSEEAKNSFMELLDEAKTAVGFNADDYKIKVDAKALLNGDYVFVVTKLVRLRKGHKVAKPKPVDKNSVTVQQVYAIYKFDCFDDFCEFCSYLKSHKINYINTLCKSCVLYKFGHYYYLSLKQVSDKYKKTAMFYTSITEFSKFFSSKAMFISTLKEHGEIILDNNAIVKMQKIL